MHTTIRNDERPATGNEPSCLAKGGPYVCTRPRGHAGDHVAHGGGIVCSRWASMPAAPTFSPPSPEERRAREAPLVALVNAVPEGLDANGWRAMILMLWECWKGPPGVRTSAKDFETWAREPQGDWPAGVLGEAVRLIRSSEKIPQPPPWLPHEAALYYREAIAPQGARPKPERKIGGRAVRLVLDSGED